MPSSKSERDGASAAAEGRGGIRLLSQEMAALGMDLHATLREEPRFLLDARLLGALHQELGNQLSVLDARAALVQMGFLHGLRDSMRVVRAGFGPAGIRSAETPVGSRLPLKLARTGPSGGGLSIAGSWPEQREAQAVLRQIGEQAHPSCAVSAGFTSGWLSGIYDVDILAVETSCLACGAERCEFLALDSPQWQHRSEPGWAEAIVTLPFAPLRDLVVRHLDEEEPLVEGDDFEFGTPVVHVWGPVMVIPFSGPDESLRALELIGRDPGAREVRVVVLDLSGAIIDDGFGAAALEQILDAVEGWGAEPILTGVSPLSAAVVADLSASHLVISKDLPEAIALGFQVAQLQRRGT